jgi:hypothetical protein
MAINTIVAPAAPRKSGTTTAASPHRKYRPHRERRRYSGNSSEWHRIKALTAAFRAALGAAAEDPIVSIAIMRAAELTMLAEGHRAKAIRGEPITVDELLRIEAAADRAVRRLGIRPVAQRDTRPSLHQYLADRYGEQTK